MYFICCVIQISDFLAELPKSAIFKKIKKKNNSYVIDKDGSVAVD